MDYRKREQKHRFNLFEKELKRLIEHYSIDEHSNMSSIKITKFILGGLKELSNHEKWILPNTNEKDLLKLQVGDEISFQKINYLKKGITINKWYKIKDIFNARLDSRCIAFTGDDKRRVVYRSDVKTAKLYEFQLKFQ